MTDAQLFDDHLVIERHLPAPPDKVWAYLVDPTLRERWFCGGATDDKVGGRILFDFDDSKISGSEPSPDSDCGDNPTFEGTLTDYDPPHHIAFTWPEQDSDGTHVSITLSATTTGTKLRLVHEQLKRDDYKSGVSAGWHAHLDLLVDLASGHAPRDFWEHYRPLEDKYKKMLGL
ncbi:MAG: SRPBCC family protein [Pseudomonadota bacterium]